jgi:hypothetical protein
MEEAQFESSLDLLKFLFVYAQGRLAVASILPTRRWSIDSSPIGSRRIGLHQCVISDRARSDQIH